MPRILIESNLQGTNYLLFIISFISVFFAIYIIISKNPILSVLFLIGLFLSISVYLITIGLHFLGLVYLIVYVGAVSILFLFILMLINVRISELLTDSNNSVPLAILTILCFNYSVYDILPYSVYLYDTFDIYNIKIVSSSIQLLNNPIDIVASVYRYLLFVNISSISSKSWDAIIVTSSHITSIGNILYTNLFILFIITALILLLAMVGAIIITINKSKTNNNLEWNLTSPVKAHAFVSLPLQSLPFIDQLYRSSIPRRRSIEVSREETRFMDELLHIRNSEVDTIGRNIRQSFRDSQIYQRITTANPEWRNGSAQDRECIEEIARNFTKTIFSKNELELITRFTKFKVSISRQKDLDMCCFDDTWVAMHSRCAKHAFFMAHDINHHYDTTSSNDDND